MAHLEVFREGKKQLPKWVWDALTYSVCGQVDSELKKLLQNAWCAAAPTTPPPPTHLPLSPPPPSRGSAYPKNQKAWTPAEDAQLRRLVGEATASGLAAPFNRAAAVAEFQRAPQWVLARATALKLVDGGARRGPANKQVPARA